MNPTQHGIRYFLAGGFHRMAFTAWGDADAPVVVCVHGLTRNGRDFDPLAAGLADRFRVICPDLPGRGQSDWLPDPMLYQAQHYVIALGHLLAVLGREVAWVGTSLGGICGMVIAAAAGSPIGKLVLNDVGPALPAEALARLRDTLPAPGLEPRFADLGAVERHLRHAHASFGSLTDARWANLALHAARILPDGGWILRHDPAIAAPLRAIAPAAVDLWPLWGRIRVPVLAIRGETSDFLRPDVFARMRADGARGLTVPGAGHAPALMDAVSIAAIRDFLLA